MALGLLGKAGQFVAVVVLYLIGVVGNDVLRFAESNSYAGFHRAVALAVVPLRKAVHCLHQHHRHTLGGSQAIVVVREPGEGQTLQESAHLTRHVAKVYRRAQHQPVGISYLFQHGRQGILELAYVRGLALNLARHARHAALIVKVIQAYSIHFNQIAHSPCAFGKLLQHRCRIEILPRTSVDNNNLFHLRVSYAFIYTEWVEVP